MIYWRTNIKGDHLVYVKLVRRTAVKLGEDIPKDLDTVSTDERIQEIIQSLKADFPNQTGVISLSMLCGKTWAEFRECRLYSHADLDQDCTHSNARKTLLKYLRSIKMDHGAFLGKKDLKELAGITTAVKKAKLFSELGKLGPRFENWFFKHFND